MKEHKLCICLGEDKVITFTVPEGAKVEFDREHSYNVNLEKNQVVEVVDDMIVTYWEEKEDK